MLALLFLVPVSVYAQADKYFPESTKGFVSISNLKEFTEKLDQTSLGDLRRTPEAKAFFDSFSKEVMARIQKKSKLALGLSIDELKAVVDGEVAIGLIRPKDDVLAVITLAEFSDAALVDKSLKKVEENLLKFVDPKDKNNKVKKVQEIKEGGQSITQFQFPDPYGIDKSPQVFYGRTDKYIVSYFGPVKPTTKVEDHVAQARLLLKALTGGEQKSLAARDLYKTTMKKLVADGKYAKHEAKWFIESFSFIDAAKKIWPDQFNDDRLGSFRKVGFDAIKAAGGIGLITPGKREMLIRGFIYAPPVDDKNRFLKAAKMLDFTADKNRLKNLPVWVDGTSSSYFAMHSRMLNGFDASEPLVDELYGPGTMSRILENFKTNPMLKANFDVRDGFAKNLGDRIVAIRDPSFPAKIENNRIVFAIDIKPNKEDVKKGSDDDVRAKVLKVVSGYMANEDPNYMEKIKFKVGDEEITIFKKNTPVEEDGDEPGELDDLDDLDDLLDEPPAKKPGAAAAGDPLIKYICIAQYKGQILVSPDLKFLKEVLNRSLKNKKSTLADQQWFKDVNAELDKVINPTFESLRYAIRIDLPYRAAFQLIKESKGDLPIERLIKKWLKENEKTRLFDVSKMPKNFDKTIAPHLGFIGWSSTTEADGWMLNGVVVRKNALPEKPKVDGTEKAKSGAPKSETKEPNESKSDSEKKEDKK